MIGTAMHTARGKSVVMNVINTVKKRRASMKMVLSLTGKQTAALYIYLVVVIGELSLYPTSILVIIFLKPVRNKLKAFIKSINRS